ncbi:MAG TPA: BON domain-containing protein [Candidatus Acidoferrum sp.]|nr:BON domain-containing protein [Candidatus Acidoferrum sp.]
MRRSGVLLALLVLLVMGCASVDPLEDTRIEAEVKARLVAEKSANLTRIGVLSANGAVYLSGTVASEEVRARATALATGVSGVTRVVNSLQIRPAREESTTPPRR